MKTLIQVKRKHIRDGRPGDNQYCAVAIAIKDQHPETITPLGLGVWRRFSDMPRSVQRFVSAFDAGKKVKPFNFFLVTK